MNYEELSKEVSYALRHAPWEYELEMDGEGWVEVVQLIEALNHIDRWKSINCFDLVKMIDFSDKKRHEIANNKIRAFYGHSIPMKIQKKEMQPPDVLFHGTARKFLGGIIKHGLLPKTRQYVHLSQDKATALCVGKRRDEHPIILQVEAHKAWEEGINFYFGHEKVWLADIVPSKYIILLEPDTY